MRNLTNQNLKQIETAPAIVDDWEPHSPTFWQILLCKEFGLAPMMRRFIAGVWLYRRMTPLEERLYKVSP